MTQALIVIDVQNDFCPGGALAVPDGDAVVARINAMMESFDAARWRWQRATPSCQASTR